MTAVLFDALKEQQQITSQQNQIDELRAIEAQNSELKAELATIRALVEHIEKTKADRK